MHARSSQGQPPSPRPLTGGRDCDPAGPLLTVHSPEAWSTAGRSIRPSRFGGSHGRAPLPDAPAWRSGARQGAGVGSSVRGATLSPQHLLAADEGQASGSNAVKLDHNKLPLGTVWRIQGDPWMPNVLPTCHAVSSEQRSCPWPPTQGESPLSNNLVSGDGMGCVRSRLTGLQVLRGPGEQSRAGEQGGTPEGLRPASPPVGLPQPLSACLWVSPPHPPQLCKARLI